MWSDHASSSVAVGWQCDRLVGDIWLLVTALHRPDESARAASSAWMMDPLVFLPWTTRPIDYSASSPLSDLPNLAVNVASSPADTQPLSINCAIGSTSNYPVLILAGERVPDGRGK